MSNMATKKLAVSPETAGIDLSWHNAWKSLSLRDVPLKRALWAALCAAYASNELVMVKNKAGTLHNHNIEAAISRIVDSSGEYPHLTCLTQQSPDIARGRIFHQICAGLSARKHAKSELQSAHDERVTEKCIGFYKTHFKRNPSPSTVLGWLFHDLVEDHGVTLQEITSYSHASVANAVRPVSIPSISELRSMYPELDPANKMALKHQFKEDMAPMYTMDNVILKFFDGLDAFTSYINEMDHGFIFITNLKKYEQPKGNPPVFLLEKMQENLQYRREGNKQLMDRCRAINNDPELNPHHFDYTALIPIFENEFSKATKEFEARLITSAIIYDKGVSTSPLQHIAAQMRYLGVNLTAGSKTVKRALKNGVVASTSTATTMMHAFSTFVL